MSNKLTAEDKIKLIRNVAIGLIKSYISTFINITLKNEIK